MGSYFLKTSEKRRLCGIIVVDVGLLGFWFWGRTVGGFEGGGEHLRVWVEGTRTLIGREGK
jgi:hypothetical protein